MPAKEALAIARDVLQRQPDGFAADADRRFEVVARRLLASLEPRELARLVEAAAAGDAIASEAARQLAARYIVDGALPPNPLRSFAAEQLLNPGGRPGRSGAPTKRLRDARIAVAVMTLRRRGFNATRSEPHRDKSPWDQPACGCSIVAHALRELGEGISEGRVVNIWNAWRADVA